MSQWDKELVYRYQLDNTDQQDTHCRNSDCWDWEGSLLSYSSNLHGRSWSVQSDLKTWTKYDMNHMNMYQEHKINMTHLGLLE
jgi:hypothetical protein